MRYRPFRASGASVSAVSFGSLEPSLDDHAREQLFQAALIAGINAYELGAEETAALSMLGDALRSYDRALVMMSVRVGKGLSGRDFSPGAVMAQVEQATRLLDIGALDLVMLDGPTIEDLTPDLVASLRQAHAVGMFGAVGVRAEGAAADALVRCGAFRVLSTRFNLLSGWPERNLIRSAIERGMTVVGHGFIGAEQSGREQAGGEAAAPKPKRSLLSLVRKREPAASELEWAGGYRFLRETPGWTDEAICLAYAMTEPALATVQARFRSVEHLQALAAVPERDLTPHLSAQIEMARFAAVA